MSPVTPPFRVVITADLLGENGKPHFPDCGLSVLEACDRVGYRIMDRYANEIEADQIGDAHGVLVLSPKFSARSIPADNQLLAVARYGVGFDSVDIGACTANDIAVCTTRGAVDRPVAEATVMWMMALSHHMLAKDRVVRTGHWEQRKDYLGRELRGRTLGIVGLGGIGRALLELLRGFGMNQTLAFDPVLTTEQAADLGVKLVSLDELLAQSDFVSLHCPLNDSTRDLIGERELNLMRRDAYLINTARGGIINEPALYTALKERRIAGAAIDCFNNEPLTAPPALAELDNVLLAPHGIAWTEELFRDIGRMACGQLVSIAQGIQPPSVVNAEVFAKPSYQAKWKRALL